MKRFVMNANMASKIHDASLLDDVEVQPWMPDGYVADTKPPGDDCLTRLLCDPRTLVASETATDVQRGDIVYFDWKGRVQLLREGAPLESYIALYDAPKGTPVAIFGMRWEIPL